MSDRPWLVKRGDHVFSYCSNEEQARTLARQINAQYQTDEYYAEAHR